MISSIPRLSTSRVGTVVTPEITVLPVPLSTMNTPPASSNPNGLVVPIPT